MFRLLSDLAASPLRLKVVVYFFRRPNDRGSAMDVATTLHVSRTAVQRELQALERLEFVRARKNGRTKTYTANTGHPLFTSFARFLADALTPSDKKLAELFRPILGVQLVVSAGLLQSEPKSPVDLLIVSRNSNTRALVAAVKKAEVMAALPLRYAILSASEYRDRRQAYDRLLRDVFEYRHAVVLERGSL